MGINVSHSNMNKIAKINNRESEYNLEKEQKITNRESLIKCTYEIKEYNEIQIINNRLEDYVNEDIETKIKIWSRDGRENLSYKTKFNKLGLNTIYFIIEEKINDLSCIFNDCTPLKQIQFINPQTEKVNQMIGMFNGCKKLESVDLSGFDTSNVNDFDFMFNECYTLKEI